MSIVASAWAWTNEQVTDPLEALVLLAICDAHNDHRDECFPTIERIAFRARVSRRTAINKINSLTEKGLIQVIPEYDATGRQRANSYKLNIGEGIRVRPSSYNGEGARAAPQEKSASRKGEGAPAAPRGAPSCTGEGANCCTPLKISEEISEKEDTDVSSKKAKRGTRLSRDWQPDSDLLGWAGLYCSHFFPDIRSARQHILGEHAKFVDYWTSKAGQGATKLDWDATFRNWIRKSVERRQPLQRGARTAADIVRDMGAV